LNIHPLIDVLLTTASRPKSALHRDFETRSQLALGKVGAHRYAADRNTEVVCCAYAVDDETVQLWIPGNPVPPAFLEAASNPNWIAVAHNAGFEMAIERHLLGPRFDWPQIPIEQQRCTQAMALAAGLPARLSTAADALELANRKDAAGERLMHQMSKPRRVRQGEDPSGTYWFDDPDRLQRLHAYCRQDVQVERELFTRLPPLAPTEQALWILSNKIKQRGFRVDRGFAEAARKIAQAVGPEIDAELSELTAGAVSKINQIARLLSWLQQQGCTAKSLDRKAIEKQLLDPDLSPPVQRVLELRSVVLRRPSRRLTHYLLAPDGEVSRSDRNRERELHDYRKSPLLVMTAVEARLPLRNRPPRDPDHIR
jgi:DNA polymerase bacteriophage-type